MAETQRDFRGNSGIDSATNYGIEDSAPRALALVPPSAPQQRQFTIDLATLWRELVSLKWFTSAGFCSATHCFLVLERHEPPTELKPTLVRALKTLERVLTGESPKVLAYDSSVSQSTVAARCGMALSHIGVESTVSAAPTLFILAAHAARGMKLGSALVRPMAGAKERFLVRYERPDRNWQGSLTEAEVEVVRLLIEGRTHAQMSQIRDRSERTIANQLGAAFRKVGVSGRTALVAELLRHEQSKADANAEQRVH